MRRRRRPTLLARRGSAAARIALSLAVWITGSVGGGGCQDRRDTVEVTVRATPGDDLPAIVRIVVSASKNDRLVSASASTSPGAPVALPAAVRLNVTSLSFGEATIEAKAFDISQTMVASGTTTATLPTRAVVIVDLRCDSLVCSRAGADGGADAGADVNTDDASDAGPDILPGVSPTCGNGRIDPGETCDIARAAEFPGTCPTSCDDGIACTRDQRVGDRCSTSCEHEAITANTPGDGCCPAQAEHGTDTDCSPNCGNSRVDPGEACDTAILSGPGACPNAPPACDDQDPCTTDQLISDATCSARCVHAPIVLTVAGDGCCPLAADATTDSDCPASCGNGIEEPGETCDTGIGSGTGACPTVTSCDDGSACTLDMLVGSGCQTTCTHKVIDTPIPGDGCCPGAGLSRSIDSDCPATCGNGVVEAGETCDTGLPTPAAGGCPLVCPAAAGACIRIVMQGSPAKCSVACVPTPVTACSPTLDGCCPRGCTQASDPDCSATCGNGKVDIGETCDTAIATGAGACPRGCSDGVACTDDLLIDGDTCNARCLSVATTAVRRGDGCCPPGADASVDPDCPATCGNGIVEVPWETCDTGTTPTSCSPACPPPETCATWKRNATTACDARCVRQPIAACVDGDGCCAPGCNATNDSDCAPRCGNGILEFPETCDRGITAGHAGACSSTCTDGDPCTLDFAHGAAESCTWVCSHVGITACGGGDRCCPAGCTGESDSDCVPSCGDGQVQAQETCDPASTCQTSCQSDGDPCTVDELVGSATACTAACAHVPILRCSGTQRDGCCPTACSSVTDSDC